MKQRNLIFVIVGVLAVIGLGILAAGHRGSAPIDATIETVRAVDFTTRLPETGVIQRPQIDTLTAQVAGNIGSVAVQPGQHVRAGQVLVTLDNAPLLTSEASARANYEAAAGRLSSARQANALLPVQNQSSVDQARYNLEQAKSNLSQALTDERNGAQSGLGYGGSTAQSQRVAADANVANAETNLHEAQRIYDADVNLYANKAISNDALSQQAARLAQAKVSAEQARGQRDDTYAQLSQNVKVLRDRVTATRDAVRQAQAALSAALVQAGQSKAGDVEAAAGDAAAKLDDWRAAQAQVARLTVAAPYAGIVQTIASESTDTLRPLQPGDRVTGGQSLVTIAPDEGFVVRARVDEQDIAHVHVGERALVSGEDLANHTLRGRVVSVGAVAQKSDDPANTSRQVLTTIKLDQTLPYLRDGMNVDVDIVTRDIPHALAISTDAIRHDGTKTYVYTVHGGDNMTQRTPVTLGAANDTQTIVTSGLRPGMRVVDDQNPAIGDHVAVKPAASPAPAPSPAA